MSRSGLILLSVVDCAFGLVSIFSDGTVSQVAYGINFMLAVLLAVLVWQDLGARGFGWPRGLISAAYVMAPLIGLIIYALVSDRPKREDAGTLSTT